MFLSELNTEESNAFLSLVTQFAKVDETFAKEEKRLIDEYLDCLLYTSDAADEVQLV